MSVPSSATVTLSIRALKTKHHIYPSECFEWSDLSATYILVPSFFSLDLQCCFHYNLITYSINEDAIRMQINDVRIGLLVQPFLHPTFFLPSFWHYLHYTVILVILMGGKISIDRYIKMGSVLWGLQAKFGGFVNIIFNTYQLLIKRRIHISCKYNL